MNFSGAETGCSRSGNPDKGIEKISFIFTGKDRFMFGKSSDNGYTEVLTGIQIKTIVYRESTLMTEFKLRKDAVLIEHTHVHEQTGYLVKGKIRLFIGDTNKVMNPGDSWCVSSNVRHRAEILEDSIALEIFSPCREDYLKYVCKEDVSG